MIGSVLATAIVIAVCPPVVDTRPPAPQVDISTAVTITRPPAPQAGTCT